MGLTRYKPRGGSKLSTSTRAIVQREQEALALLAKNGPMRSGEVAKELGYAFSSGAYGLLSRLVRSGQVQTSRRRYYLPGVTIEKAPSHRKYTSTTDALFSGDTLTARALRYLRDHQGEPLTLTKVAKESGFVNAGGITMLVQRLMKEGRLRRWQEDGDFDFLWRYEFLEDAKEDTKPMSDNPGETHYYGDGHTEHTKEDEPVKQEQVVTEAPAPTTVPPAPVVVEQWAKDFMWQTGSRDTKEFVLWLKERAYTEKSEGE